MSTLTAITVVDISPSLALKMSDKASLGVGFDIQVANAEFDNVAAFINPQIGAARVIVPGFDTRSTNTASDTGYGFHAGIMWKTNWSINWPMRRWIKSWEVKKNRGIVCDKLFWILKPRDCG